MKKNLKFSVVIPSYNSQDYLRYVLDSVFNNKHPSFEVIVVDCSESSEVEKICSEYKLKYKRELSRFNPGIGRNIGAKYAEGEYLVFVDSDVILNSNTLKMLDAFIKDGVCVCGAAFALSEKSSKGYASKLEHAFFNHESYPSRPATVRRNLSSAFLLVRKDVFLSSGGFKDIARMQDTEFTERLSSAGYILYFNPNIIVSQIQDSGYRKVFRKIYINGFNTHALRSNWNLRFGNFLLLAISVISIAKIIRITWRAIRFNSSFSNFIIVPLILLGGFVWFSGFCSGKFSGGGFYGGR